MASDEACEDLQEACVKQAVSALFALQALRPKVPAKKRKLLDDEAHTIIGLRLFIKKISQSTYRKMIRTCLPHPITSEALRICLIVKDLKRHKSDNDEAQLYYKEMLASKGIDFISEVLPLNKIRTDYQTYEAKRKLCHSYDLFVAAWEVELYLPEILGREFVLRRKMPPTINMTSPSLKETLISMRDSTFLYLMEQQLEYVIPVGLSTQREEQVVANIFAVASMLKRFLPGGWMNVRRMYVKTESSMTIPLYVSFGDVEEVIFKEPYKAPNDPVVDELTTLEEGEVAVFPNGYIKVVKRKKKTSVRKRKPSVKLNKEK